MSKPSIYRHFTCKDDLVLACVNAEMELLCKALRFSVAQAGPRVSDRLSALVQYFVSAMAAPGYRGFFSANAALEFQDPDHPVRVASAQAAEALHAIFAEVLTPAAGARTSALARHLQLLVFGAATAAPTLGGRLASGALEDAIADACDQFSIPIRAVATR